MNNAKRVSFFADLGTAGVTERRRGCRLRWKKDVLAGRQIQQNHYAIWLTEQM